MTGRRAMSIAHRRRSGRPAPPPDVERRWYEDKIGGALLGGGLAARAVGIGFLIHASSLDDDASHAVDEQTVVDLTDSAHRARVVGGILAGVGAATIAGGVLKMVLYGRR